MTIEQIKNILSNHGVPFYVQGGRILADSMIAYTEPFQEVVDLTDYTRQQLFAWLGY